ncbi:MAG: zf-HC2 domain-containing protein [Armatimonadota bacterium]|nr:anti-sigma factor [Armatimonadota bacterium]MCX7776776.1 anti-sigma factor [Armatimonadota bacterium]MDW8024573.1 zf-HC2 domain-containing protein [Armatimonadota bacterium]
MRSKEHCRKYRELIPLLIDGELDEATAARVEHHLNRCRGCMNEFKWHKWLCLVLRSMPYTPAPPDFTERTLERIRQLQAQKSAPSRIWALVRSPLLQFAHIPAYAFILLIALFAAWTVTRTLMPSNTSDLHSAVTIGMTNSTPSHVGKLSASQPRSPSGIQHAAVAGETLTATTNRSTISRAAHTTHRRVAKLFDNAATYPNLKPMSSGGTIGIVRTDVRAGDNASEGLSNLAHLRVSLTPIKAEPQSTMPAGIAYDSGGGISNPLLTEIKQMMSMRKLSQAVERLSELVQDAAAGEPMRYRALCLLKACYEMMGEWVLAKSVAEQIVSELKASNDANLITLIAQACESDGDSQFASELYSTVAEHAAYPTSLRAYAQTRLASLRSGASGWLTKVAPFVNENAAMQTAPAAVERQSTPLIAPQGASPSDSGERQVNGDTNLLEDLFKLAEAI